ncbi:MAG: AsmA-like C-terminal domain-containing protein [Alphaproteobacteria bacterium]
MTNSLVQLFGRLVFLVVMLITIAAGALLYRLHADPISLDAYKMLIMDDLEKALKGADFQVTDLRFGFLASKHLPVLMARRVLVDHPEGEQRYEANNVVFEVDLLKLIGGDVDLKGLSVDQINLRLKDNPKEVNKIQVIQELVGKFDNYVDDIKGLATSDFGRGLDNIRVRNFAVLHGDDEAFKIRDFLLGQSTDYLMVSGLLGDGGNFFLRTNRLTKKIEGKFQNLQLGPLFSSFELGEKSSLSGELNLIADGDVPRLVVIAKGDNFTYKDKNFSAAISATLTSQGLKLETLEVAEQNTQLKVRGHLKSLEASDQIQFSGEGTMMIDLDQTQPLNVELHDIQWLYDDLGNFSLQVVSHLDEIFSTASLGRQGGEGALNWEVSMSGVGVDQLISYWPEQLAPPVRKWINDHIPRGTFRDITARHQGEQNQIPEISFTLLDGQLNLLDEQILVDTPEARGLLSQGMLSIGLHQAFLNGFALSDASVVISGIDERDQELVVDAKANGNLENLKKLLSLPKIDVLTDEDTVQLPQEGTLSGQVTLKLPLIKNLLFKDVHLAVEGNLYDVSWPLKDVGEVTSRAISYSWSNSTPLSFQGGMQMKNLPFDLRGRWTDEGGLDAQVLCADIPLSNLSYLFADESLSSIFDAKTFCDIRLRKMSEGNLSILARLDLDDVRMGRIGRLLLGERVPRSLHFQGGNDDVIKNVELRTSEEPVSVFISSEEDMSLRIRATGLHSPYLDDGTLLVQHQSDQMIVLLEAMRLDVAKVIADDLVSSKDEKRSMVVKLRVNELDLPSGLNSLLSTELTILPLAGGKTVIAGQIGGDVNVSIDIREHDGSYKIVSDQGGEMLALLGMVEDARGGRLQLDVKAQQDDISGILRLDDVQITSMPIFMRLLSVASLQGVIDGMQGKGIRFSSVELPFSLAKQRIQISKGLAKGPSVGVTVYGSIVGGDNNKNLQLRGNLIPVYGVNSIVQQIPLVGDFITGGERQGIFSINYKLTGPSENPTVWVNPAATMLPGPIKRLFQRVE